MEKTRLYEARTEPEVPIVQRKEDGLFTFNLTVRGKLKANSGIIVEDIDDNLKDSCFPLEKGEERRMK